MAERSGVRTGKGQTETKGQWRLNIRSKTGEGTGKPKLLLRIKNDKLGVGGWDEENEYETCGDLVTRTALKYTDEGILEVESTAFRLPDCHVRFSFLPQGNPYPVPPNTCLSVEVRSIFR